MYSDALWDEKCTKYLSNVLMNHIIYGLQGCVIYHVYIDDAVKEHLEHLVNMRAFLERLPAAKMTVNLTKSDFDHAYVTYLGHIVGQGQVRPRDAKVKCILEYPVPTTKKELMRFLGMAGYYRKFCQNFADIASPLTNLLSKKAKFEWSEHCQKAFEQVKAVLTHAPLLMAPDFDKPFKVVIDAR